MKLLLLAVCAGAIQLFARNLESQEISPLGSLNYDPSTAEVAYSPESEIAPGSYCIGASDVPDKECFTYLEVHDKLQGDFVVYIDGSNQISELTFVRGSNGLGLRVEKVVANVVPNLNPFMAKQQTQQAATQKITRKRVVEDESGQKVEVEEVEEVEVDNRSWIQKNWMYIVPPLLLFLVMSPDDKSGGQAS